MPPSYTYRARPTGATLEAQNKKLVTALKQIKVCLSDPHRNNVTAQHGSDAVLPFIIGEIQAITDQTLAELKEPKP